MLTSSYNLFLDDERFPLDVLHFLDDNSYKEVQWHIVRDSTSFIKTIIEKGVPYLISFDNDLADFSGEHGEEITGYKLANWLVYYCIDNNLKLPVIVKAHTRNVVDRPNIFAIFDNARKIYPKLT